jgi:hypothetical protein
VREKRENGKRENRKIEERKIENIIKITLPTGA